jgi:hypothetical protein
MRANAQKPTIACTKNAPDPKGMGFSRRSRYLRISSRSALPPSNDLQSLFGENVCASLTALLLSYHDHLAKCPFTAFL